jgi:DNA helicase-2/ATP-dependent DNA helicase PcrA
MIIRVIDSKAILEDLTEPQRAAVTHDTGPLLIVAAAGSGKTRVITRRVAYLISQGIAPSSILAITFTNKAAGEMKARVGAALGRELRDFGKLDQYWPTICTFHSLCLRVLRHYAPAIGLPPNFSVYDSSDQNKVVKDAIKTLELSSTNFAPSAMHSVISNAKNQLVTPEQYTANARDFFTKQVARVYAKYQAMLVSANALDFDDLLMRAVHMLRDHPDILAELQERFAYILIDEYQDTNKAQYVLAHALAMKHRNICVVGDPDQSIYRWRGADIRNILDFERDYTDATVVKLEQNYRSTKTILKIAGQLIANNRQRKEKQLWTDNDAGAPAKLLMCRDERDEAQAITAELQQLHEQQNIPWSEMAIFYRMNALSRVMEDALRTSGVPYQIARGVEFYNRKEIKDVLAYLRVIANPNDEVSLDRIANTPPRGISDPTMTALQAAAVANGVSTWQMMTRVGEVSSLNARAVASVQKFVTLVNDWRKAADAAPVGNFTATSGRVKALMERVVKESGYEKLLEKLDTERDDQLVNVSELITSASEYDAGNPEGTLVDYLAIISLVSDADHMAGSGGAVTLMTLHAAKGLEFPVVAMIGLEDGILPHSRSRDSEAELEEERRLCFVGITRAEQRLIMSKAQYRTIRGLRERTVPSVFIGEMPKDVIDVIDRTDLDYDNDDFAEADRHREHLRSQSAQLAGQFRRGQMVRHKSFGIGKIAEVVDMGQHTRAVVEFQRAGRKTLILQYAQLEVVN